MPLNLANEYAVVFDACVLAPMPLCDTLLRLAEEPALYMPRWSREILNEVERTLIKFQYSQEQVKRRTAVMSAAFEESEVFEYEDLIPAMTNDAKDRHVLAAAVRCGAHGIVTFNRKHFPQSAVAPYNLDLMTPNEFLGHQFYLNRDLVVEKLSRQAANRRLELVAFLEQLRAAAPDFVDLVLKEVAA